MNLCPPVAILHRQKSAYTPVRKTATTSIRTAHGKPYTSAGFSAIWQRLITKHVKAGGERFSFHDLRSVSADGAATAEEARDRLGHASVETTKRHYLRGVRKAKRRS